MRRSLVAGALAVALAGAAALVAATSATATGSPYSISDATAATLAGWGLQVNLWPEGVNVVAEPGSYAVAMADKTAYAPTVFPPIAAGSTVSVTVPAAGGSEAGEPWVREITGSASMLVAVPAHSSYWPGSTVAGGLSVAEWVTDWSTSEIPDELATVAGRLGHNPATYSDCAASACGFWVSPATLSTVDGVPVLTATADSVFVAVTDDRSTWTAPWPDETAWTVSATGLSGTARVPSDDGASDTVTEVTITSGSALGTMYPTVDAPASAGDTANGVPANSVPVLLSAGPNGYYSVHSGNPIRTTVVSSTSPAATASPVPTISPSAVVSPASTPDATSTTTAKVAAAPQRVRFETGEDAQLASADVRALPADHRAAPAGTRTTTAGGLGMLSLVCAVAALRCARDERRRA